MKALVPEQRTDEKWLLVWPSSIEYHVVPIGDFPGHIDEDCPCQPLVEAVHDDDGEFAAFGYAHNAWDGRE